MADPGNPILKARPPATDYMTYLTILEYNLTADNLPVLHDVLQDSALTINIGWDLVHLLVPLVRAPAAEQCLLDIARLGNPREVVLKVTECLRQLQFDRSVRSSSSDDGDEEDGGSKALSGQDDAVSSGAAGDTSATTLPLPVAQFTTLLSMLSIIHPRIKTKYPSRFLSQTLQAVFSTFAEARTHTDELAAAIVTFVKTVSGAKRPHLPPRRGTGQSATQPAPHVAPDPEEQPEKPSEAEHALQLRLLQAFVTHVLEEYLGGVAAKRGRGFAGLAWAGRLWEKMHPERLVPGKSTATEAVAGLESLQAALSTVGQMVALAQDLGIEPRDLRLRMLDPEEDHADFTTEDPPASAEDVTLSKTGSLYLYAARLVAERLYETRPFTTDLHIFPDHAELLRIHLDTTTPTFIGSPSPCLIDALLALGLITVEDDSIGESKNYDEFYQYLQKISLLSANVPFPELRFVAHHLTCTILHSHKSDFVRLAFIRDTLEHCPHDNLKESAVGWLKRETLQANQPSNTAAAGSTKFEAPGAHTAGREAHTSQSIFATPVALETTAPSLFPDLRHLNDASAASSSQPSKPALDSNMQDDSMAADSEDPAMQHLLSSAPFYMAVLNFLYLILLAPHLQEALNLRELLQSNNIMTRFLQPLKTAIRRVKNKTESVVQGRDGADDEDTDDGAINVSHVTELDILEDVLCRVEAMLESNTS